MRIKQQPVSERVLAFTPQEKKFALKFYRWALRDAQREFSEGFPFLKRLKSTIVADFLEFVGKLSTSEKKALQSGLVERFHEEGAFLSGDKLSPQEGELIERFLNKNIVFDRLLGRVSVLSRSEAKQAKELASGGGKYQIEKSKLREALEERLVPALVGPAEVLHKTSSEWRYSTPVGNWKVHTTVDTGGRLFQLSYSQMVSLHRDVRLVEHASILNWLGIAGQTHWDLLSEADVPGAAQLLAEMSSHFIDAIREIEQDLKRR